MIMIPVGYVSYEILFGMPLQTLNGKNHYATLSRNRGILGYRLSVVVDGAEIYRTGKIMGASEMELRVTLVWDETGRIVVFEQMGKIVFAYDAEEKRKLDNDELKQYCLSFMPEEYRLNNQNSCREK